MTRFSFSLLLLCSSLAFTFETGTAGELKWLGWSEGLAEAKKTGKPVLVDVYTDWCGWCKRMDRDVYARKAVREYLGEEYVTIKLDAEARDKTPYQGKDYTARSLAGRKFRVTGYPTTVFLDASGDHLVNVPGYIPAERFMVLLSYIREGHFEQGVSFEQFAKRYEARKKSPR